MIKKIVLILIFFSIVISCGKKQDPKYENVKKDSQRKIILNNKT